jgi:hypothetical protein
MSYDTELLLLEKNAEIRRLQYALDKGSDFKLVQASYENLLADNAKEIRRLDKEILYLSNDYDELFEANADQGEKITRLEMELNEMLDFYNDQADVNTWEKNIEISALRHTVRLMADRTHDDAKTIHDLMDKVDQQAGVIDSFKNARDGLLTWAADEIEILELEKAANKETLQQLQSELSDLKYMRRVDDGLFNSLLNTWKRQLDQLAKFKALRKDGTLDTLLNDASLLEEHGHYTAAEDIQRVVRIIKEDARKCY